LHCARSIVTNAALTTDFCHFCCAFFEADSNS
jgi:hypothetical protein